MLHDGGYRCRRLPLSAVNHWPPELRPAIGVESAGQGDEQTSEAEILRFWLCVQISKKLACGDVGNGALAEPSAIAEAVRGAIFPQKSRLQENTLSIPVVNEHCSN